MKKYVLDTNYLYSLFEKNDENHKFAVRRFSELPNSTEFTVPYICVAELLIAEKSGSDFVKACKQLSGRFVNNTKDDLVFIRSIPLRKRRQLKANDCLILAIAQRMHAEILTFDKIVKKAEENLVTN